HRLPHEDDGAGSSAPRARRRPAAAHARARARDVLRHGRGVPHAAPARRAGRRLAGVARHGAHEGSRLVAARHERQRPPLRRVRTAHVTTRDVGLPAGDYLALLSHSGSRGTGATVADHYSKLARKLHPELPQDLAQLAWLDLSTEAGQEYWGAMELMGRYAAANHALIHAYMARALGVEGLLAVENHHNFAWRERHPLPDGSQAEGTV